MALTPVLMVGSGTGAKRLEWSEGKVAVGDGAAGAASLPLNRRATGNIERSRPKTVQVVCHTLFGLRI